MGLGTYLSGVLREARDIPTAIGTSIKAQVPQQFSGILNALPHGSRPENTDKTRLYNSISSQQNMAQQLRDLRGAVTAGRQETKTSDQYSGSTYVKGVDRA